MTNSRIEQIRARKAAGKPLSLGDRNYLAAAAAQAKANIKARKERGRP